MDNARVKAQTSIPPPPNSFLVTCRTIWHFHSRFHDVHLVSFLSTSEIIYDRGIIASHLTQESQNINVHPYTFPYSTHRWSDFPPRFSPRKTRKPAFGRHGKRLGKSLFHTFQSLGCHNSMTWFKSGGESIRSRRSATSRPSVHKVPAPPRCVASERGVPQRHAPGTVRVLRVWSRLPFRSEVSYWIRKFCFHKWIIKL